MVTCREVIHAENGIHTAVLKAKIKPAGKDRNNKTVAFYLEVRIKTKG